MSDKVSSITDDLYDLCSFHHSLLLSCRVISSFPVSNNFSGHHIYDVLGNIGSMVCNALQVPGNEEQMCQCMATGRFLLKAFLEVPMQFMLLEIYAVVFCKDLESLAAVQVYERSPGSCAKASPFPPPW